MKISVIGGGIGGLATAVALQRRGFDAHVYESATELKPVGKGIWLPTNAMLVLDRLELGDAIAARGVALERLEVRDKNGDVLQAVDLGAVQNRLGRTTVSVLRTDLQAVLADALCRGTLHLGKRCISVSQDELGAVASFDDGTRIRSDVLVGADGIHSVVRELVSPGVSLRDAGQACYLGVADYSLPPELARTVWEVWGGAFRFGFSAVAEDKVYWFAPVRTEDDINPTDSITSGLAERYTDFPDPVQEIIQHTQPAEVLHVSLRDFAPIQRWFSSKTVLVGDAAHAMTPNLGQGGAQAIEDAYVLAAALGRESTLERAFVAYEQTRQPKAKRIVNTAWRLGQLAHVEAPWGRRLRNTVLRSLPQRIGQRQAEALYSLNY